MSQTRPNPKRERHGSGAARREALKRKRERQAFVRKYRLPGAIGGVVVIAALLLLLTRTGGSSSNATAATAFVAQTAAKTESTIDNIPCESSEQLSYHTHAHLAVYVNGKLQSLPTGIGINRGKPCIYWLHTHTSDGVVHIEAPSQQSFTLGQFFDVWGQSLSPTQVATAHGPVTAFVNGQAYTGDLRAIALDKHSLVQLNVGSGNPGAQTFNFPSST